MSTARTCTTPEDGWALYNYFLCNLLWILRHSYWEEDKERKTIDRRRESVISDTWAKLAGNLYLIMRRMQANGHHEDAAKMQQIIDMVVELDLTDHDVCYSILNKEAELNPGIKEYIARVTKSRAKYEI